MKEEIINKINTLKVGISPKDRKDLVNVLGWSTPKLKQYFSGKIFIYDEGIKLAKALEQLKENKLKDLKAIKNL